MLRLADHPDRVIEAHREDSGWAFQDIPASEATGIIVDRGDGEGGTIRMQWAIHTDIEDTLPDDATLIENAVRDLGVHSLSEELRETLRAWHLVADDHHQQ